jgi:hypothetical protein
MGDLIGWLATAPLAVLSLLFMVLGAVVPL